MVETMLPQQQELHHTREKCLYFCLFRTILLFHCLRPDRKSIWHLTGIDAHCIKASKMKKFGLVHSLLFIAKKVRKNIHQFSTLELPLLQHINHCLTLLHFCSGKLLSTRELNYREKENHKKTSRIYKCHFQ